MAENVNITYTVKKFSDFPVPGRDVSKSLLSGIPAGDGKIANLFSQCNITLKGNWLYHLAKDDVVIDELLGESHGVTQVHIVISWSVDQEQLIVPKMMDIPAHK